MRNVVLVELARRWRKDAEVPEPAITYNTEQEMYEAKAARETKRECADTLLTLIDVMPD